MNPKRFFDWIDNNIWEIILAIAGLLSIGAASYMGITELLTLVGLNISNNIPQGYANAIILLILSVLLLQHSSISKPTNNISNNAKLQTLDQRLKGLVNSLTQAGEAVSAIEREIDSRKDLVNKLEKQKKIAEKAITLSREQVDAVSALLSEQVARQSKQDNIKDWIKQIFFFILGVLATILLTSLGLVD